MDRRAPLLLLFGLLVACPREEAPDPTTVTASVVPAARKLEVAEPKPTGCEPAPAWVGIDACQTPEGFLYATGRYELKSSARLARAVVAARARARAALLGRMTVNDEKISVQDGEVPFVHRCNDTWVALARVKVKAPATIPACPKDMLARAPIAAEGCPDWAAKIAWKDGDFYYGVADVPPAKNVALARSAAQARALTAARAVLGSVVGADGKSATIDNTSKGMQTLETKTATCSLGLLVQVKAQLAPK